MQTTGGIGDQHVDAARLGRLHRIEDDRGGIGAGIDYLDADGEPFSVICSAEIPIEQVSYTPEFISKKTEDAYVELCKLADESVRKQRAAGREEYHLMITWQDLKDVVDQPHWLVETRMLRGHRRPLNVKLLQASH